MAGNNSYNFCTNSAAGTFNLKNVQAGKYMLLVKGTFGSVQMNVIDPSGNAIPYGAAITANGASIIEVPAGTVQAVATAGSAYTINMVTVPTITTR